MSTFNRTHIWDTPPYEPLGEPAHEDMCEHGKKAYIGSATFKTSRGETLRKASIDVYIFDTALGQNVCIRYGGKCHEYISPGNVLDLLISANHKNASPEYRIAADLVDKNTTIRATVARHSDSP